MSHPLRITCSMRRIAAAIAFVVVGATSTAHAGKPVYPPSVTERSSYSKPFWIDKSMFVVGDHLLVVGVASKAATLEEGRAQSLESAKNELRGRSKILGESNREDVDTKDLYEEREP